MKFNNRKHTIDIQIGTKVFSLLKYLFWRKRGVSKFKIQDVYSDEEFETLINNFYDEKAELTDETQEREGWDDPGDYPSGAGGGPLPSYEFYVSAATYVPKTLFKVDMLTPEMKKELIETASGQISDVIDRDADNLEVEIGTALHSIDGMAEFWANWTEPMPDPDDYYDD